MTPKQEIFVDEYLACFNATEAAKRAGYSEKTAYSIGQENLTKPEIKQAIAQAMNERKATIIATREQRQKFWTEIMNDVEEDTKNRLRASELLGRACGDFVERIEAKSEHVPDIRSQVRMILLERENAKIKQANNL